MWRSVDRRFVTTYLSSLQGSTIKMGGDRLSRNVCNLLPIYPAQHPRRENSFTPRWKSESRTVYLHSVRLIRFRLATILATAALLKLCHNTVASREQLLDSSRKIWPSKTRLVLLKVSEDDTLKTDFGLQFSPNLLIQRTQNCHRCGHTPQLSSLHLLLLYHISFGIPMNGVYGCHESSVSRQGKDWLPLALYTLCC